MKRKKYYKFWKTKNERDEDPYNITLYPQFDLFRISFGPGSYFNNKFHINCFLSQIISLLIFIIWCFIGISWWALLLIIPFFVFPWGKLYIHLPFIRSKWYQHDPPSYGAYLYGGRSRFYFDCLVIERGGTEQNQNNKKKRNKYIKMPWAMQWYRTSYLVIDRTNPNTLTWLHEIKGQPRTDSIDGRLSKDKLEKILYIEEHPYKYVLRSGIVQERTASVYIVQREWRPLWFMWTGLFKEVSTSIDVTFNDEVGERSGSWKGGTIGCGYEMKPSESMYDTLKRMEKERKFT